MTATAYASHVSTRQTPQSQPIPGKTQVQNSAGGYAFAIDDWKRLERWLILGADGGTYYATERQLVVENAECVERCLAADYKRTIDTIAAISEAGRAPKNDPAIFALAYASGHPNPEARKYALGQLARVCRIPTHLFQFVECVEKFRGWGRGLKRAVRQWYLEKPVRDLAYQITKYQQRGSWSHRDLLRLAKPRAEGGDGRGQVLAWAVGKLTDGIPDGPDLAPIRAFEEAKRATDAKSVAKIIRDTKLVRECVPTQFLNSPEVWRALLQDMPLTAMIRSLGKMGAVGLLTPMSDAVRTVRERLGDTERLQKSRVHPIAVLLALSVYRSGHGLKGGLTWPVDGSIVSALDGAFYGAFANVEPTGKRHLLGIDVSGSMASGSVGGTFLTPREAASALAMVTVRTEDQTYSCAFQDRFVPFPLSKSDGLADVVQRANGLPFGRTDCSLPMIHALQHKIPVDVFVSVTDNETWAGNIHPCQALTQYRQQMGINAKLIVVGLTSTGFTIADPNDAGMLDVVGMDASAPAVMADFAR